MLTTSAGSVLEETPFLLFEPLCDLLFVTMNAPPHWEVPGPRAGCLGSLILTIGAVPKIREIPKIWAISCNQRPVRFIFVQISRFCRYLAIPQIAKGWNKQESTQQSLIKAYKSTDDLQLTYFSILLGICQGIWWSQPGALLLVLQEPSNRKAETSFAGALDRKTRPISGWLLVILIWSTYKWGCKWGYWYGMIWYWYDMIQGGIVGHIWPTWYVYYIWGGWTWGMPNREREDIFYRRFPEDPKRWLQFR